MVHLVDNARSALITGITGQDGSFLAEFLLDRGYRVSGMVASTSEAEWWRIKHLEDRIELILGDLGDQDSLVDAVAQSRPREIYNLAAQSFVPASWTDPLHTGDVTGLGVARMLEAVRKVDPLARFYQASSSEMFGKVSEVPQNESTPFYPRSPYGVAKVYGHYLTVNYRESYGMFAVSGILFNHESQRRGFEFVPRKISYGVARIKHGLQDKLMLGNLDARRDWGYAPDYVNAMWLMLQQAEPTDFVIATGETHTVSEFVERAFEHVGLDWRDHVEIDKALIRPAEVDLLVGDASKARAELGWEPTVTFDELVRLMVDADVELVGKQIPAQPTPSTT